MTPRLKDMLQALSQQEYQIRPMVFRPSRVVSAAASIGEGGDQPIRMPLDLDRLQKKLLKAARDRDFSTMDLVDWRYSTLCLEGTNGILTEPVLLKAYLDVLEQHVRGRILRGLARVYLHTFISAPQAAALLANFLLPRANSMGRRWAEPASRFHLFNPGKASELLTAYLLRKEVDVRPGFAAILDHVGLPSDVAVSELGIAAFQAALRRTTRQGTRLSSPGEAQRIIDIASNGRGELALQGCPPVVQAVTDALLLPFRTGRAPEETRSLIETYLLRQLRDPRLDASLWHPVSTEAKAVMHSWLTEQSLELFLGIVDKVVNRDDDARRMWRMRGKFWRAYHRKRYINQAWVVLGVNGVREVRRVIAQSNSVHEQSLSYATLSHSSDTLNHIALIMKIDCLVVVDWSHNGRCHIWHERNPNAPALYKSHYRGGELTDSSESPGPYVHVANGSWRWSVAEHIKRETNISMPSNEYS